MTMRAVAVLVLALGLCGPALSAPPATALYALQHIVPIGGPDHWDYMAFDAERNRLLVAHEREVTVLDGDTGAVVGHLAGLAGAHGIAIGPARLYADSGLGGTLSVFDRASLKPIETIPAGADPDAVAYDPASGRIFVMNGDPATATVIDAATDRLVATVTLGGEPEFAVADGTGGLFVNLKSTREVVRLDTRSATITARFRVPDCEAPHGLALDVIHQRLFTSCENRLMLALDMATGQVLASVPIGAGSDAAAFDPFHGRAFSSNGDGTLSVVASRDAGPITLLAEVPTLRGARTMALDARTGRVFLVTADIDGETPPTTPGRPPRPHFKPGTLKLLILAPM